MLTDFIIVSRECSGVSSALLLLLPLRPLGLLPVKPAIASCSNTADTVKIKKKQISN